MKEDGNSGITYEKAVTELEEAVSKLERGDLSLEESMALFENAVSLVRLCNSQLDNIEKRITILVEGKDGVKEKDFLPDVL